MAIPPQFLKNVKSKKDTAAQDAKESPAQHAKDLKSGKDNPRPGDPGYKGGSKGAPKKDSKDPKGAKFDGIPSGPLKGQNPNFINQGGSKSNAKKSNSNNAKRGAMLAQLAQLKGGK